MLNSLQLYRFRISIKNSLALAFIVPLAAAQPQAQQKQTVNIVVLTCPSSTKEGSPPRIELSSPMTGITLVSPVRMSLRSYMGSVALPIGHYDLFSMDEQCKTSMPLNVILGHNRTVGLVLREGRSTVIDARDFIAGDIPFSVSGVSLTTSTGASIPLVIDNGAYYGEELSDGHYTLVLKLADGDLEARLPVIITSPGIRKDITAKGVISSIGLVTGYYGKPPIFRKLWPDQP